MSLNSLLKKHWKQRDFFRFDTSKVINKISSTLAEELASFAIPEGHIRKVTFCQKLSFFQPEGYPEPFRFIKIALNSGYPKSICLDTQQDNRIVLLYNQGIEAIGFINADLEKFLLCLLEEDKIVDLLFGEDDEYQVTESERIDIVIQFEKTINEIDPAIFDYYHWWPATIEQIEQGI